MVLGLVIKGYNGCFRFIGTPGISIVFSRIIVCNFIFASDIIIIFSNLMIFLKFQKFHQSTEMVNILKLVLKP